MNTKEQILLHVSANEDEIDELLDDRSLMNLLTVICGKHKANLPIYISFLIKQLDDAFSDPGDAKVKELFNGKRPRLKEFIMTVCLYAEMRK
jgi:hypothetical protein